MIKSKSIKIAAISCLCICILAVCYLIINFKLNNNTSKDNTPKDKTSQKKTNKDVKKEESLANENDENEKLSDNINKQENSYEELTKVHLDVPQSVQENNYYCVPASLQMVLRYHGIEKSQSQLAKDMHTDPITGTEYIDLANIANKYIFNNSNVTANDPGYHVQTLNRYDTNPEIAKIFEQRVKTDISTNDPVFVAIDVNSLYPELSSGNHIIVLTGYTIHTKTNEIAYYHYIDPFYKVQDAVYGGLKTVTSAELINAIVSNIEPAYIW
ncbi:MAG: C39 family peptidase [Bacilli bacterium]|nr:C39 family peptidase [Bacilli bacterium]